MEQDAFQQQMIDRTARMETKMDELFRRQEITFQKIDAIVTNCTTEGDRLTKLETTVNGTEDNPGLSGRTGIVEKQVQGLTIKAAVIGLAVGIAGAAGINLSGLFK